ncbi:MAG: hypothetical protein QOJ85_4498 [Solirubrobacteraceae bacterium]|jgi:hypothetical protein|nr:hypothetical protein [Solirubrobacteraceae bacterium]MEA2242969.1 hypothetical protein [Solirubrobacteraceae bacterium]
MTDAASDLALTPGDPTQTIHFKIAVALNQMLTYTGSSVRAFPTKHELAEQAGSDDPALRREYLIEASLSWILIGWASALVVAVFAVVTGALFGHGAGNIVFNVALTVGFFCFSGAFSVLWRWYWYLPQARRRARKNGVGSAPFAAAMRGASPRNSSLIFQWTVAVVTFVVALVTLL